MNKRDDGPNSKPYIVIDESTIFPPEGTSIIKDYSRKTVGMTNWRYGKFNQNGDEPFMPPEKSDS